MTDDTSSVWFYWPMLGTGIGGLFGADWKRREIDKYLRRRGN